MKLIKTKKKIKGIGEGEVVSELWAVHERDRGE
jgi:hypothetical protein